MANVLVLLETGEMSERAGGGKYRAIKVQEVGN